MGHTPYSQPESLTTHLLLATSLPTYLYLYSHLYESSPSLTKATSRPTRPAFDYTRGYTTSARPITFDDTKQTGVNKRLRPQYSLDSIDINNFNHRRKGNHGYGQHHIVE